MRALLLIVLALVGGCPKDPEVVEIPGRSCVLRLNLIQPDGVDSLRSDLPGDEGRFSALDLTLTRGEERIERRLTGDQADETVVRFGEPINFVEGDRFDLELLVRSPSGRVFALGRHGDVGCTQSDNEVVVNLPLIPVNRWIALPAPELERFEHRSIGLGAGALFVGGRKTPRSFAAPQSDAGPPVDANEPPDAGPAGDASTQGDAGPNADAGGGVPSPEDAGLGDVDTSQDGGVVGQPDAGAADTGSQELPSCEPHAGDVLLGEPAENSVVFFDRYRLRFVDRFETQSRRDLTQVPRMMGSALFHQSERQRVLLLGGLSIFGGSFCDQPPLAQFHIFDYADLALPRLSSLTWGEDQRDGHFALQRLVFAQAIPVEHDLIDVALLGGYWGRHQTAPQADWPPRHDPPTVELPHRMAVVNASNFVSRRDTLRAPNSGGEEIRLPFGPEYALFGDGSALVLGGWEADRTGVTGPSERVYQLLRSNTVGNVEMEVPHLYGTHALSLPRADGRALGVHDQMVLVMGGLEGAPQGVSPLELYRWRTGGRRGFREGGTLEHLPVVAVGEAQIWDRGFAATTLPCQGPDPCPVLLVGGERDAGVASNRALILRLSQVENNGQLTWQVVAEALPEPLPEPRWGASVTLLDDGSYLVAGGRSAPPGVSGEPGQQAFLFLPYEP